MKIIYDLVDIELKTKLKSTVSLREHQVGVADTILKNGNNGIIRLGCGFGKTIISCEIIRKLNKTALIIVPRTSLLYQFVKDFKKFYGYKPGVIQAKVWKIEDITIASMSTLKKRDLSEISKRFSIVIADEAHTVISEKGIEVIQSFNPKYLYGATATPRRSDMQCEAIKFTFGEILIDKKREQEKPTVHVVKSNVPITGVDYMDMVSDMVENERRNELIFMLAGNELLNGRKILILTKRVSHFEAIKKLFPHKTIVHTISSKTPQKERDILLTKLRNNEEDFDVILGTYSMLSTGVDIPSLDTLIFAGDLKSDVLAEQSIGRILRIFIGKANPKIIDIDDNLNGLFHRQHLARKKFYKENNWEIIT